MPTHSFGYKPSKPDTRDFLYKAIAPKAAVALPPSVDLRDKCSPVRDQGQLGSCTGFAIAVGMREFLEGATPTPTPPPSPGCSLAKLLPKFATQGLKLALTPLSPLFLYYEERALEGTIGEDAGAEPRDGFKVLNQTGCATEVTWPYIISRFADAPSAAAVQSAADFKIATYHRLADLTEMKTCLAGGSGFVIGFYVYSSFEAIGSDGKMPMPKPGEQLLGGHAVFVAGYFDDASWPGGGYLVVKNSWGAGWGAQGYFYMPYAFVTPDQVPDAWTATL
jgi:C1A family cysteine protease